MGCSRGMVIGEGPRKMTFSVLAWMGWMWEFKRRRRMVVRRRRGIALNCILRVVDA